MDLADLSTSSILIVDDQESNLVFLEHLLRRKGYQDIISISDARNVITQVAKQEPDLILLDLMMPHLDGFQVLTELNKVIGRNHFVPVVILTAEASRATRLRALAEGAIDFLIKPLDAVEVLSRIHNLLYSRYLYKQQFQQNALLEKLVAERTHELLTTNGELGKANVALEDAHLELLAKLSLAAEYRDDDSGEHPVRVAHLSYLTALHLGLPIDSCELILQAARLHDIGKIGIPDDIVLKPGKLNEKEMSVMKTHCAIGSRLLAGSSSKFLALADVIALTHHERWDGKGYPEGLIGTAIPIEGRIVSVADLFDALTHDRWYRPAWAHDEVVKLILEEKGQSFDPEVVDAFLQVLTQEKLMVPNGIDSPTLQVSYG
jgi:putative two-component system response regulator